ncbi:MAG TPA: PAS domain S-box protein [Ramlibacter sp.]|uniref:PAS domain S-box protein n=1 Tax=Ramlibacter sp. TaxID=1917967 RepID=UPI002ED29CE3
MRRRNPPPVEPREDVSPALALPLARLVLSGTQATGQELFTLLVRELAATLEAPLVFLAAAKPKAGGTLRTLAACLDGQVRANFSFPAAALPEAALPPGACHFIPDGALAQWQPRSLFARQRMDAFLALPLADSAGEPLGMLVAMHRRPLAGSEVGRMEALLHIAAGRASAEIERHRTDETLRAVALAVSASRSGSVFDELVRVLATVLQVEVAFIAQPDAERPGGMRMLALYCGGKVLQDIAYPLAGSPCATVVGQCFRAYPGHVQSHFPDDRELRGLGVESYAGHPLVAGDGSALGLVSVASQRPLAHLDRVKATLKIFAVRAAAEVERLRAGDAQKQALEDLRQREEQYRAIFESSLDGLFLWDEQLRVVDANRAALALYGYSREEVIGRTFPRTMPAEYVRDRLDMVRRALAGESTHVEAWVLRPNGSSFDAELRVMPFVRGGRPHALAAVRDISERRRRERELQQSEEQYRSIFNASVDAMVLRAADFSIVDVNATYEAWTGYSRAEVLGVDRVVANPAAIGPTIRALHEQALAGATVRLETQLLCRDGPSRELELRGVPIVHRGEPHVLYIGRDITQAKRAEQARRDSEEQYRAIFHASADALVLRDASYRAVEVNPAYLAMSGYSREEVTAAARVLTQADRELQARHRLDHDLALAGRQLRFEVTATRKDGTTLQAEVRGTPMTYRGQPHVLYAVRDISERVAAEQRRAELERQLRQAQKMEAIGHLTGGLAHDFNNILTSVLGYVDMALERPAAGADPALARELGQARLAAERAREHVAQLLAFSRPRRGERRLLVPAQLTAEAVQLLRPNLPSSITVDWDAGSGGDAAVPPVLVDPVQFEQVLLNLFINARDAIGEQGCIRLRIAHALAQGHCASCSARLESQRWVAFEVADDGPGMRQDVVDRMFEPFFTTKEVGRGTGMGLAMVHGILHDHGGHIQVATAPGLGSSFRVLLPAALDDSEPADAPAAVAADVPPASPLQGRVLLVEDEPIVSGFMQDLMRGWGLEVVLEADPRSAARRLSAPDEAFALLLTDQTMPGMTGLALARLAQSQRPGLPVLLYTGNALDIAEQDLSASGVSALLRKPIDTAVLRPLLRDLLAHRSVV